MAIFMKDYVIWRQYCVPQHLLSRIFGWLANARIVWLKNWMIIKFINRYQVDMQEAIDENIEDYASFNQFFIRKLKPELRSITQDPKQVACPADGNISQIGQIAQQSIFQAKGFYFTLSGLLGSEAIAAQFVQGSFATFYLSPKDYHRVHMPLAGKLIKTIHIPGKLFSVSPETTRAIPHLFARNERVVCIFETDQGPMAVILVGAMIVGSIHISSTVGTTLAKGEELGYFKLGSTVIVLLPEKVVEWQSTLQADSMVKMGQAIGRII